MGVEYMNTVLIVDDEVIERKYIRSLLEGGDRKHVTVIGECNNGAAAVETALKMKPDIIFMDIQMPLKDGLEASKEIKQTLPNVQIVILSAFNYFDYAKKAIKVGVHDYLLKPYSDESFQATLDKVLKAVKENETKEEHIHVLKTQVKQYNKMMEKEIIINLANNESTLKHNIEEYMMNNQLAQMEMDCIVIKVDSQVALDEIAVNCIKLMTKMDHVIGYMYLNDIILLVFGTLGEELYKNFTQKVSKYLQTNYKSECIVSIGNHICHIEQIPDSYLLAIQRISKNNPDNVPKDKVNVILHEIEEQIFTSLLTGNKQKAKEQALSFLRMIQEKENSNLDYLKSYVVHVYIVLLRKVHDMFGDNVSVKEVGEINADMQTMGTLKEVDRYFQARILEISETVYNQKQSQNDKVVKLAKEYLDQHYKENISLMEVAEEYNISHFHLSKMFKKILGINYKDYLVQVRMEKAKELIRKERKTISEISQEVGYMDPNYFSKVFKKYTGMSPSEYANI